MSELDMYDTQLTDDIAFLQVLVDELKGDSLNETKIKTAQNKIDDILETKKHFGMELRQVKERARKKAFEEKFALLDSQLSELTEIIDAMERRRQRAELLKTQKGAESVFGFNIQGKGNQEVLDATSDVQDKMELALDRTENRVEETTKLGVETIEQLEAQRDQMKNIHGDLDSMETNLQKANRLITEFTHRMMTDRLVQAFTFINTVLLGTVVVLQMKAEGKL